MNEDRFLTLLAKLIGETEKLQNNPAQGLIPQEDLASNHVLAVLEPFSKENGGPLEIERVTFVEGRGNVIIKYPGTTDRILSFVGSHLDVVPASPDQWERDPFTFSKEGDLLYGRGTTDCLGHVALITDFFATLAEMKPTLKTSIVAVFIANEENGSFRGVGVDQLSREGYLDGLKHGPVYWIDAADSHPCQGTSGVIPWKMEVHGRLFHSGLPHKAINSIEMAMDALNYMQRKFYADFPRDPREDQYSFTTCSTMKPTQVSCTEGSLNQVPPVCTIQGDIRLCPFYDVKDACDALRRYAAEINADPCATLQGDGTGPHGPHSKYELPEEEAKGRIELTIFDNENGIAVNRQSEGFSALVSATEHVLTQVKPYAIGGSLPLVRDMQNEGFDIQIVGYGLSAKYHANNECASLTDLKKATKVLAKISSLIEEKAAKN